MNYLGFSKKMIESTSKSQKVRYCESSPNFIRHNELMTDCSVLSFRKPRYEGEKSVH